jgi:hypothetical protein
MRKGDKESRGFGVNLLKHTGRGGPARAATTLLFASTLFLITACAAPPAQNQKATPAATPQASATAAAAPAQAVSEVGDIRVTVVLRKPIQGRVRRG